jgi:phosphoserine phosphatase RsbU/P
MKPFSLLILLFVLLFTTIFAGMINLPSWFYTLSVVATINAVILSSYHNKKISQEESDETSHVDSTKEVDMAKRVQEGLLSLPSPSIEGINIAKRCIPAKKLGGDFYTFIGKSIENLTQKSKSPGIFEYVSGSEFNLGIAVGDVAGHGVSSALVMALSAGLIDKIAQNHDSPKTVLEQANNAIYKFISNSQISHLTAIYAAIQTTSKTMTIAKAGHHAPIILKADDSTVSLESEGTFLGMFENESYEEISVQLESGDRIFFFTDGIVEAQNRKGADYSVTELTNIAIAHKHKNIDELMEIIFSDVSEFISGTAKDDQTLVIVEIV